MGDSSNPYESPQYPAPESIQPGPSRSVVHMLTPFAFLFAFFGGCVTAISLIARWGDQLGDGLTAIIAVALCWGMPIAVLYGMFTWAAAAKKRKSRYSPIEPSDDG